MHETGLRHTGEGASAAAQRARGKRQRRRSRSGGSTTTHTSTTTPQWEARPSIGYGGLWRGRGAPAAQLGWPAWLAALQALQEAPGRRRDGARAGADAADDAGTTLGRRWDGAGTTLCRGADTVGRCRCCTQVRRTTGTCTCTVRRTLQYTYTYIASASTDRADSQETQVRERPARMRRENSHRRVIGGGAD